MHHRNEGSLHVGMEGGWSWRVARTLISGIGAVALVLTTVGPVYAVSSSVDAPALAGLPAAPSPAVETSGEDAADVSPYDHNNVGGSSLMAFGAGPEPAQTAKFTPPDTPYNGAFTRTLALEVPPFFEITPKLVLGYDSGNNRLRGSGTRTSPFVGKRLLRECRLRARCGR
jgi:hypothetical protein